MSGPVEYVRAVLKRRREKRQAKRVKGPKDHWLREALETLATAVIMALVVRHFAVEAFKIPTESMSPTLYGDEHGGGAGDRILVNKFPLYFRGPARWAIVVFRFPLDAAQNYVKRLVGLPGELLELRDGDAWVDGKIERKPSDVQDEVWREVVPGGLPKAEVPSAWVGDDGRPVRTASNERTLDGRDGPRTLKLRTPVSDRYRGQKGTMAVGDLRLRFEFRVDGGEGSLTTRIVEHGRVYEAVLATSGSSVVRVEGEEFEVDDVEFESDEDHEIAFVNVDDAVELHVDGDRVFRHEYETDGQPQPGRIENAVEIVADGVRARIVDLAVDRDIAYCAPEGSFLTRLRIPPDCYVMLGDNSSNSHDSRRWRERVFLMKDGEYYRFDPDRRDPVTGMKGNMVRRGETVGFVDVEGLPRVLDQSDLASPARLDGNARMIRLADGRTFVALLDGISYERDGVRFEDSTGKVHVVKESDLAVLDWSRLDHAPFVTRAQIVGEAFFVFWPMLPPAGFRIRFL